MTTCATVVNVQVGGSNPPPATITLLERYLCEVALLRKPGTLREARRICFEALPFLTDDPRSGVLAYLSHCKARGDRPRTTENRRIRLGAFYRSAGIKLGIAPIRFVMRKPEAFTQGELDAIFACARGRNRVLYEMLLKSGLRMSEAMALRYSDLLLDSSIRVAQPKGYSERIVAVPRSLITMLRSLPTIAGSPLVFPTKRGTPDRRMLRGLKRVTVRAGIDPERVWLHKFRSTFATRLLRGGLDIREVMRQMGHADMRSTLRYLALLDGESLNVKIEQVWSTINAGA